MSPVSTVATVPAVTLFPHQQEAVEWMRRIEHRPRIVPEQPHGGILAHAMGLGKTITMLSLVKVQGVGCTIVVCPKSVLGQWRDEAHRILHVAEDAVVVYHGANRQQLIEASAHATSRIVLTTFDIVRLDAKDGGESVLHMLHWDRVILDEAHRICEQSSKTARAIRALKARNRWCVTGTPFKNGVTDLVALSKFLLVPPYCNSTWWRCHSQNKHKLREWRNTFLHMQDKSVLTLPCVDEVVVSAPRFKEEDVFTTAIKDASAYTAITPLADASSLTFQEVSNMRALLSDAAPQQEHELLKIMRLRQAANHPLMLCNSPTTMNRLLTLPLGAQCLPGDDECSCCGGDLQRVEPVEQQPAKKARMDAGGSCAPSCEHVMCMTCASDMIACLRCVADCLPVKTGASGRTFRHSGKTDALWTYLEQAFKGSNSTGVPDKVVLFSQWTTCLDMLSTMLDVMGFQYARFDGRVNSIDERGDIITQFREQRACRVLLTSLGAGGEGLNLTFANHVILMEPYWNCAAEQQAVDRLHRMGQSRVTNVLRLLSADSIEDWVQTIQHKKTRELERLLWGRDDPTSNKQRPVFRALHGSEALQLPLPGNTASTLSNLARYLA